jgi:5-hydroxyisourate hydrolase
MRSASPVTTHVLDISRGRAASGIAVTLEIRAKDGTWKSLARGSTDADGRVTDLLPAGAPAAAGTYRLGFETGAYHQALGVESFHPWIQVIFELRNPQEHHHVPLLLSPHGYSTYRGT